MFSKNGNSTGIITDGPHVPERSPMNHPAVESQQAQNGQSLGKTLHLRFRLNKYTENTLQYKEVRSESEPLRMGTIYIQKWLVPQPYPDLISVTVDIPLGVDVAGRS